MLPAAACGFHRRGGIKGIWIKQSQTLPPDLETSQVEDADDVVAPGRPRAPQRLLEQVHAEALRVGLRELACA